MAVWEATARTFAGACVRGPDDAAAIVRAVFGSDSCHRQVVLPLDEHHRLVGFGGRAPERSQGALVASHIVDVVHEVSGVGAVAATLRPGPPTAPGADDIDTFRALAGECGTQQVALLDWLIVVGHHWWSMRERSGKFPSLDNPRRDGDHGRR